MPHDGAVGVLPSADLMFLQGKHTRTGGGSGSGGGGSGGGGGGSGGIGGAAVLHLIGLGVLHLGTISRALGARRLRLRLGTLRLSSHPIKLTLQPAGLVLRLVQLALHSSQ